MIRRTRLEIEATRALYCWYCEVCDNRLPIGSGPYRKIVDSGGQAGTGYVFMNDFSARCNKCSSDMEFTLKSEILQWKYECSDA